MARDLPNSDWTEIFLSVTILLNNLARSFLLSMIIATATIKTVITIRKKRLPASFSRINTFAMESKALCMYPLRDKVRASSSSF